MKKLLLTTAIIFSGLCLSAQDFLVTVGIEKDANDEYSTESITNNLGQQVFNATISKERFSINVSKLGTRGTYFLQVLDGNRNVVDFKYIVLQ